MNSENLPTPPLDSREAMLETLKLAYRQILDFSSFPNTYPGWKSNRLTVEEAHELGRRLAQYWSMKTDRADAVPTALSMVAESDARMNTYTPAQRAALEKEARDFAAYYEERFKTEQ